MRQFSPLYLNILIIQNNNQRSQWDDSQMQEVANEAKRAISLTFWMTATINVVQILFKFFKTQQLMSSKCFFKLESLGSIMHISTACPGGTPPGHPGLWNFSMSLRFWIRTNCALQVIKFKLSRQSPLFPLPPSSYYCEVCNFPGVHGQNTRIKYHIPPRFPPVVSGVFPPGRPLICA